MKKTQKLHRRKIRRAASAATWPYHNGDRIVYMKYEDGQECMHGIDGTEPCAKCAARAKREGVKLSDFKRALAGVIPHDRRDDMTDAELGYIAPDTARARAFEEAAIIAETEPELPGMPTPLQVAIMNAVGPIKNARAAVRDTKRCIAERIRAAAVGKSQSQLFAKLVAALKRAVEANENHKDYGWIAEATAALRDAGVML